MLKGSPKLVVGLSGGADSVALTSILYELRDEFDFELCAAHVNHNLRGDEAKRDELFVKAFCQKLGIALEVLDVDILAEAKKQKRGVEEYARDRRYRFFSDFSGKDGIIATAHTLSDSIETILFNMTRGAGLKGLTGIPAVRGNIIRPLIECTRTEIEDYCSKNNLQYVTDSTNMTDDYTRNFIRHNVVPLFYEINPSFNTAMIRMIENISGAEKVINEAENKIGDPQDIRELGSVSNELRHMILKKLIYEKTGCRPERKHVELADLTVKSGKTSQICGGVMISAENGKLVFRKESERSFVSDKESELSEEYEDFIFGSIRGVVCENGFNTKIHKNLSNTILDRDKIKGKIFARTRRPGDCYRPNGRNCTKSLKKLFNENHIPVEIRGRCFVLYDDDGIIWTELFGPAERVTISESTRTVLKIEVLPKISGGNANEK